MYFLIMELLGSSLSDIMVDNQYRRMCPKTTFEIALELTPLIREIHFRNVIHGDIQSGNVLMGTGETLYIWWTSDSPN